MKCKAIGCDWNGTLFYDATDKEIHKEIIMGLLKESLKRVVKGNIRSVSTISNLLYKSGKIIKGYANYQRIRARKEEDIRKKIYEMKNAANRIYEIFNESVLEGRSIDGLSSEFLNKAFERYAKKNRNKLDIRIARPIRAVHQGKVYTFIISGSYQYAIKRVLDYSKFSDAFDEIIGTRIKEYCGIVVGIDESPRKEKTQLFINEFLKKRGYREQEIIYFGDCEFDLEIGEILPPGNFIVSFFSEDDFKEFASTHYKAFVPESEEDLLKYLISKV